MRLRMLPAVVALTLVAGAAVAHAGSGSAAPGATSPAGTPAAFAPATTVGIAGVEGLPKGAPPAARQAEPTLPEPDGWPFRAGFPRTSGTGRLLDGASYWTDFVYDDHGALGVPVEQPVGYLAPTIGTYVYPDGPANGNGADIFRAAVGATKKATYWRVDWTTLVDADVPIAEWTFGLPGRPGPAGADWPAAAGLAATGADLALVVSSRGARLVNVATGATKAELPVTVDLAARSFVVRVPRTVLPVKGSWTVRLAAGLADAAGTAFASVGPAHGARPGQPAVYNIAFRSRTEEAASCKTCGAPDLTGVGHGAQAANSNLWNETAQAIALLRGTITPFSRTIDWSGLLADRKTAEPRPTGPSVRWYVTSLDLGEGVTHDEGGAVSSGDGRPNFLGRVQPYSVYVPTSYRKGKATPLTWVLHSLGVNHNQYTATAPRFMKQLCEGRNSICATTLGFGADGWYVDEAEADFWQVWHALAASYTLDPERTIISGYSMGGHASYKLGLSYSDVFAAAMPIAGPPVCGIRVAGPLQQPGADGRCAEAGDTTPLVGNARWLPFNIADGVADQLVPYTGVVEHIRAFDEDGLRYRFASYPVEDHIVYAVQDGFSDEVDALGKPTLMRNPPQIDHTWYPGGFDSALGLGPQGTYWVRDLQARSAAPGALASVHASSAMRPERDHTRVVKHSVSLPGDPTPAVVREATWEYSGAAPKPRPVVALEVANVSSLLVNLNRAGFDAGDKARVNVTTDGPTTVRLRLGEKVKTFQVAAGTTTTLKLNY